MDQVSFHPLGNWRTYFNPTRNACPDRTSKAGNSLESGGTDRSFQHPEELLATSIAPLSHSRPLSSRSLSNSEFGLMSALAAVEPNATCPEIRLFDQVESHPLEIGKHCGDYQD